MLVDLVVACLGSVVPPKRLLVDEVPPPSQLDPTQLLHLEPAHLLFHSRFC